jgi:hypothetical protein
MHEFRPIGYNLYPWGYVTCCTGTGVNGNQHSVYLTAAYAVIVT